MVQPGGQGNRVVATFPLMESPQQSQPARSRRCVPELLAWVFLALPVAILLVVPRPTGLLWDNLFNAAHVAVSFVVGLACLRLSRRLLSRRLCKPQSHYLVSLGCVAAVGGGVEALQFVVPGTPSVTDVVRDLLGGVALVLVALSVDRQTMPTAGGSCVERVSFASLPTRVDRQRRWMALRSGLAATHSKPEWAFPRPIHGIVTSLCT